MSVIIIRRMKFEYSIIQTKHNWSLFTEFNHCLEGF